MSTCLHDWLLDKSYDKGKKEKKTRSDTWEANKTDIHFLCSRSGGFFYIRFEKAEARKEIGARIKKKKKKRRRHVDRGSKWTPAEIRMKREQVGGRRTAAISHRGRDPRFHGSCTRQETRRRRLAHTGPTFCITWKRGQRRPLSSTFVFATTISSIKKRSPSPPLFLPPPFSFFRP